jgi:UDP-N-acetylglucosamine diphosphorylase/glucosamine-1-phosphate N-acetyltransferase
VASPVIIFEDPGVKNFYPLTLTRPVCGLLCGALTLADKIRLSLKRLGDREGSAWAADSFGEPVLLYHVRDHISPLLEGAVRSYGDLIRDSGSALLLNGRALITPEMLEAIAPARPAAYWAEGAVVAAVCGAEQAAGLDGAIGAPLGTDILADLPSVDIQAPIVKYPWDLLRLNGSQIASDLALIQPRPARHAPEGVHFVNESSISLGENVSLAPGAVLDASGGPILAEDGVTVMANSSLQGPLFMGKETIVKMGARIYGGTSIGPACKIGGEVAETIIQGCSNKQHDGFLGHSYLGEWVNLGAGTDTSDLKNNYSTVKVDINGEAVDSGEMFVGLFMGDHSKCGIGTTFNTGTVVGVCCNIFGSGYPPKSIPSFVWGGTGKSEEYDPARAIDTARRVMKRRGRNLDPKQEALLREVYEITSGSRGTFLSGV